MSSRVNKKNLTQPLRPAARYRPGKAPVAAAGAASDDDDDDSDRQDELVNDEEAEDTKTDEAVTSFGSVKPAAAVTKREINVSLGSVAVDESGKRLLLNRQQPHQHEEEDAPVAPPTQESSEYETDSSEEDESSEEEPAKPLYKPVFVSKRNRDTIAEREKEFDPEVQEQKRLQELEERKKQAHNLVADTIMREIAEKQAETKQLDVDDTDGLDPEGEFEAWKLRELQRLKRDREAQLAREKEREEVEARRAMPEPLRLKEDLEHARKTREEKQKGQQAFLQKYHHKGAFYADSDVLKKHDYTAPTVSTYTAMENMPKILQNKNFGKRSQTKYTHLVAEDTSSKQAGWSSRPGQSSSRQITCFHCGGPHLKKDCPQLAAGGGPSGGAGDERRRDDGWEAAARQRRDRDQSGRFSDDEDRSRRGGDPQRDPERDDSSRGTYGRRRSRSPDARPGRDGDRETGQQHRDRRGIGAERDDKRRRVDY